MATFCDRLRTLRATQGMSQRELAQRLGFSAGAVAMYETGKREPTFATANQLATMFGVTVDYLLGRSDLPTTTAPPPPMRVNPTLAALVEQMLQEKHLHGTPQVLLYTAGALTADEFERLRRGTPPTEFTEDRLVRFFRKFSLEQIRAYYHAAGQPLPQPFQDLETELRELLDRVRMSTDGSPEALEYVIQLAREIFAR